MYLGGFENGEEEERKKDKRGTREEKLGEGERGERERGRRSLQLNLKSFALVSGIVARMHLQCITNNSHVI